MIRAQPQHWTEIGWKRRYRRLVNAGGDCDDGGGDDGTGRVDGAGAAHRLLLRERRVDRVAEFPLAEAALGRQDAQYGGVGAVANLVVSVPTHERWDFPEQCVSLADRDAAV